MLALRCGGRRCSSIWYNAPGIANLVLLGAMLAIGRRRRRRLSAAQGAEPLRPQDHGSDRGLPRISRRRRGGPAQRAQSAGEDAGAVRALPALCGRARLPERLGGEIRRRAGGGRARPRPPRPGTSAAATGRAIRCRSPIISAATCRRPSRRRRPRPAPAAMAVAAAAAAAPPAAAAVAAAAAAGEPRARFA